MKTLEQKQALMRQRIETPPRKDVRPLSMGRARVYYRVFCITDNDASCIGTFESKGEAQVAAARALLVSPLVVISGRNQMHIQYEHGNIRLELQNLAVRPKKTTEVTA